MVNICRSPAGERILKTKLQAKHVSSAGIATKKSGLTGKPADAMACEVMVQLGFDLSGHQAQQLTPELCREYDLILVMEKGHIEAVPILRLKHVAKRCCLVNGLVSEIFLIPIVKVVKRLSTL